MASSARSILVFADERGRQFGHDLAAELAVAGYRVQSVDRATFPIADSLPATLHSLAARADLVVAVISDSPNATGWLARELSIETLYPGFLLAVMPSFTLWEGRLDASSFRVLAPGCGIVARVDEWFSPLPRPTETPPIGEWVPFDPSWLVRTVMDRMPERGDVIRALHDCTRTIWDAPFYQSFAGPRLKSADAPFGESIVVKDRVAGLVSIHLDPAGRVVAIGYLGRTRGAQ